MTLEQVLDRVRGRLAGAGYGNEAAVSQGVVLPILAALGWDTTDTDEVAPEFANERGRVDFALRKPGRRPVVFIEVKGVGRSLDGDRQLFEYAFHTGAPLCLLTDGREWAFYLPAGQGSYDERRVYRLQLEDRAPEETVSRLQRYLSRERVQDGRAHEDATRDYRDVTARREAVRHLPRAWADLVGKGEDQLVDLLAEETEQLCGVRPPNAEVMRFLRTLGGAAEAPATDTRRPVRPRPAAEVPAPAPEPAPPPLAEPAPVPAALGGKIAYTWFGEALTAPTAKAAAVDLLRRLTALHPERLPDLAARVRSRKRALIARSPEEINPGRPDLANAYELPDGWLVGMHTANREKTKLIRAACDVMGVRFGTDVQIELPNG